MEFPYGITDFMAIRAKSYFHVDRALWGTAAVAHPCYRRPGAGSAGVGVISKIDFADHLSLQVPFSACTR